MLNKHKKGHCCRKAGLPTPSSVLLLLIAFMSSARCLSEKYHRKLPQSMSGCHTVSRIDEGAGVDGQHPDEKGEVFLIVHTGNLYN